MGLSHGLNLKTSETTLLDFLKEELITMEEFESLFEKLALIKSLKLDIKQFIIEKAKEVKKQKNQINIT